MHIASRPNEGTTVSLWLPVAPECASAGSGRTAHSEVRKSRYRVLLVDDDPLVLMTTSDMLRELGHEPIVIASANKALEFLRAKGPPDLAIIDYAMPEMTGAALAERMREAYPTLPLILATGYSDRAKTNVDLPRLDKPYTVADLARQIAATPAHSK
jgi:CheY-like chemotaxis protein